MNRTRHYITKSDGMITCRPTGNQSGKSIIQELKAIDQRNIERQQMIDNFIPSYEFVGPEMPLNRAMRLLATMNRAGAL